MKYLKLFVDCLEKYHRLNDAEFGRLIRAALTYKATGEEVTLNGREELLWDGMKLDIDRAESAYNSIANSRSEAGKKGAARRWENDGKCHNDDGKNGKCHFSDGKNGKCHEEKEKEKEKEKNKDITPKPPKGGGVAFEAFWAAYPRHTNKQAALKVFQRLNPDDALMQTILKAITIQRKSDQWTKDGGQYIPHPATWLNGRRWEDEMPHGGKTVEAQRYEQRNYTEEELLAVDDDLFEEARRRRGTNGT